MFLKVPLDRVSEKDSLAARTTRDVYRVGSGAIADCRDYGAERPCSGRKITGDLDGNLSVRRIGEQVTIPLIEPPVATRASEV